MVYAISDFVIFMREQPDFSVTIMSLTKDILWRKTSASDIDRLVVVYRLLGVFTDYFNIGCKYWPSLGNAIWKILSQKIPKKNSRPSLSLLKYVSAETDAQGIYCTSSVPISFRIRLGLFASTVFFKSLARVFIVFFMVSYMLLKHLP